MKSAAEKKVYEGAGGQRFIGWARPMLVSAVAASVQVANAVTINLPGNLELTSTAAVEAQYDDNVYLSTENPQDDWITRITPSVQLVAEGEVTNFSGGLSMTRGHYKNGTRENFSDYTADLEWSWRPTSFLEIQTTARYVDAAQSFVSSPEEGLAPVLIEAERTRRPSAEVTLLLGRQGGRLNGTITQGRRNNEFEDASREFSDNYSIVGTNYSVSDRLTFGLQVSDRELDFVDSDLLADRDSSERALLATAGYRLPKTQLRIRAGKVDREFSLDDRSSFNGPRWDVTASWSPKSYSTVSLTTGENVQESLGVADFVDVKSSIFSWSHQWAGNLSSVFSYSHTAGEFVGTDRTDEVVRSGLTIQYQPITWLSLRFGASILENSTDALNLHLENRRYFVGIEAPL